MSKVLNSLSILICYAILVPVLESTKCKSIYANDLSPEELEFCWKHFCICNQFNNCSKLGHPMEDVMMLLFIRMGILMCGQSYAKLYEPNGKPFNLKIEGYKQTEELFRFSFNYENFIKEDITRSNTEDLYSQSLMNPYWGLRFNTCALIKGRFQFRNSHKRLLIEDDKTTEMDPVYYRMSYWIRTMDRFDSDETFEFGDSLLLGPLGRRALKNRDIRWAHIGFPCFPILGQFAFRLKIFDVILESDFVEKAALIKDSSIFGILSHHICIGRTVAKDSLTPYWTSEGCRPVLKYNRWPAHEQILNVFYYGSSVQCRCDWDEIVSEISTSTQSDSTSFNQTNDEKVKQNEKKSSALVLVLGWLLLSLCFAGAVVFTICLVLTLIK